MFDLHNIPIVKQRQDSVSDQLADLIAVANRLGMYDAVDALKQIHHNLPPLKYGCHCDLEEGMEPDDCVIDHGRISLCIYAKENMRKEQCKYWRIV